MSAIKSSIPTSKFLAIVEKTGMVMKTKASSFKVYPPEGSIKRSLDITTSKKGNTVQVLLVGFEQEEGTTPFTKTAKTVTQCLDFSQDEKLVLRAFIKACRTLTKSINVKQAPSSSPEQVMTNEAPVVEEPKP